MIQWKPVDCKRPATASSVLVFARGETAAFAVGYRRAERIMVHGEWRDLWAWFWADGSRMSFVPSHYCEWSEPKGA